MDDSLLVRFAEPLSRLDCKCDGVIDRERPPVGPLLEALPFDEFHRYEGLSLVLADLVYRADVRMIERGSRLRLANEARLGIRVPRELARQKLEGHSALELRVLGLIHHAHPALPKLLEDFVMGDGFTNHFLFCLSAD